MKRGALSKSAISSKFAPSISRALLPQSPCIRFRARPYSSNPLSFATRSARNLSGWHTRRIARSRPRLNQLPVKLLHLGFFVLGIRERQRERSRLPHRFCMRHSISCRRFSCMGCCVMCWLRCHRRRIRRFLPVSILSRALRLDCLSRRAEMPQTHATFLLHQLLAPQILILRIGLRQVVVSESLPGAKLSHALRISPHQRINAPLRISGRPRTSAAEELLVLDLQRPHVAFDLVEVFVDCGHSRNLQRRNPNNVRESPA